MSNERAKKDTRLLERALSATQSGVMITDALAPDDPVVYVNRAFEELTGYEAQEVLGRNPRFLQSGDSDQPALDDLRASRRVCNDDIEWSGVLRNYKKDGALFLNELVAAAVRDGEGRATHHIGVVTDVTERVRAEERLRFQAELLEAVGQAVVAVDLSGYIVYWNRVAEETYGWKAEEAVGRPADEVMVSEGQMEQAEEIWAELAVGRAWSGEFVVRRRDGTSFPAMVTNTPVFDERGNLTGIIGVSSDLTERRRAEEALRRSERRFRSVLRYSSDVVMILDADGTIRYQSQAVERVLGYRPEELVGENALGYLHPEDTERASEGLGRILEDPVLHEPVEYRFRHRDGSWRWMEGIGSNLLSDPAVGGIVVNSRDVTERRRAEKALRRSEELFRYMVQNSSDIITLVGDDGAIRYVSPALERVLGYGPEDRVGGNILDLLHPDDVEKTRRLFAEGLSRPGVPLKTEVRQRHKDGSWRHVEVTGTNLLSGAGAVVLNSRDVTERVRAGEALRKSEARLAEAQRIAHVGSWEYAVGEDEGHWSDETYRIFGHDPGGFVPTYKTFLKSVHPEDRRTLPGVFRKALHEGKHYGHSVEFRVVRPGGETRAVHARYEVVREDEAGRPVRVAGTLQDVTERKALEERLEHQAFHDPLTGLPNRALFKDRLEHAFSRAERQGGKVAALFVDLDNFKYVNDSLGHHSGDDLLALAAGRLRGCVRPEDTVARLGGDEFAVLLDGAGDPGEATRVAERVVEALGEPFDLGEESEVFSGASVGIALSEAGRERPEDLLRKADLALYEAKHGGKARYAVFDPGTERRSLRRLELENGLGRAVERDEIIVLYQPVVSLKTGRTVGFEALARWEHPERGLLAPDEFVGLAEETGLIVPVGERVLREACRQTGAWQEERHPSDPPLFVGVNLSAKQLSYPNLVGEVEGILKETGLDPRRLALEVTESALVEEAERHADALRGLRRLGVRFAINDFGTGYSGLSYLRRLPARLLKLDASFVAGIGGGTGEDEILLEGVVGIAHGLGLEVVAEGVETLEQASRLRELGCALAQGNYFSEPLAAVEAAAFLRARSAGSDDP